MLANQATNFFVSGKAPTRMGNAHPNLAPYQPFPCTDGMVVIAVGNDGQFRALWQALSAPASAPIPSSPTPCASSTAR
jgi:crotonobetainyl-CoA:carnitine CoA-transferase CaiB-like acyl-CoA transferase